LREFVASLDSGHPASQSKRPNTLIALIFLRPSTIICKISVTERSLDLRPDPSPQLFAAAIARICPTAPRRVLCFDATPAIVALPALANAQVIAIQGWRPLHDALRATGAATHPEPTAEDTQADLALVRLGRSRVRNLAAIADGTLRLAPGGTLIAAGANDHGAAGHARLAGARDAIARFHGRAFWFARDAAPPAATLAAWHAAVALAAVPPDGRIGAPGAFSWDRVDSGSALLAAHLPAEIAGRVADLGAGWGYLARHLAAANPRIETLDLYEADHASLAAARANLAQVAAARFHWHDVTTGLPHGPYDAIVTNPPFHDDRGADVAIGIAFLRAAARALRPGGTLWLVANRRLPYEETLRADFAHSALVDARDGYKVVVARR
jgi:16S rRNA (guanine1207-N2)-methyltransferase